MNNWKENFNDWYINISGQNYLPSNMIVEWIEKNIMDTTERSIIKCVEDAEDSEDELWNNLLRMLFFRPEDLINLKEALKKQFTITTK